MNFKDFTKKVWTGKENKIRNSSWVYRVERAVSARLTWVISRWPGPIRPNHVSVLGIVLTLLVIWLNFYQLTDGGGAGFFIAQLLLLAFVSILDKVDGELARFQSHFTQRGIYYDRLFHFLYPLALFMAAGFFIYALSEASQFLIIALLVAVLSAAAGTISKLRWHIKYKLELEDRIDEIVDLPSGPVPSLAPKGVITKLFNYFSLFVYDWVWGLYLILAVASLTVSDLAIWLLSVHLLIVLVYLVYYLLVIYPHHFLFSRRDLERSSKS